MNINELSSDLESLKTEALLEDGAGDLTARWVSRGASLQAVDLVLLFMEAHPNWDFGAPGALVHFVERFYGEGYEQKLLESLTRRPTFHTVWMLHRIVSGEMDPLRKGRLIEQLAGVLRFPDIDEMTKDRVEHFLAIHRPI